MTNLHLTCVYNPPSGWYKLYYNGRLVGQINNASIPISSVNTLNAWLGRSQWNADPGLNATINEFRIYNGALGTEQIAVDTATGPNTLVTNVGSLQSVEFVLATNMVVKQSQHVRLVGTFANVSNVNLFDYGSPTLSSSNTNVVAVVDATGLVRAVGVGTTVLTADYNGTAKTATVTVGTPLLALKHRYSFSETSGTLATDSVGSMNGTVAGAGTFDGAGKLVLDGSAGTYVDLPSGIISSLSNLTIEAWITPSASGDWPRVFDFGTDDGTGAGVNFMFLSASAGAGGVGARFQVSTPVGPYLPNIDAPSALPIGQPSYVAVTYNVSAGVATLYLNGAAVGSGAVVSPLSAITDTQNWLGRSQYAQDSYFAAKYDEFRIFEGSLLPGEIAASYASGPDTLPLPSLGVAMSGNNVLISRPNWAGRYVLESSTAVGPGATWSAVTREAVNKGSTLVVTLPIPGSAQFFRLRL